MNLENLKKKNIKNNATKSTRAERVKKFNKFKDVAHKCFGEPFTIVGICLKKCANRDKLCISCYKFSELKEIKCH